MKTTIDFPVVKLHRLPSSLPGEGGIRLELQEDVPILKASPSVQERIEHLLRKQQEHSLSAPEQDELESYDSMFKVLRQYSPTTLSFLRRQESCRHCEIPAFAGMTRKP